MTSRQIKELQKLSNNNKSPIIIKEPTIVYNVNTSIKNNNKIDDNSNNNTYNLDKINNQNNLENQNIINENHVSKTGLVYDPLCTLHIGNINHPERPARVIAIMDSLKESVFYFI